MKKANKPLSKLKIFFQSNILFQKWTKRSLSLFLFAIPFVVLIIHSCTKQFESSEGLGTPVLNVNQLDSNVAIHLSYEAETLKFSEIVDDKESFKGSEGLNKMAKIPSVERIKYETIIYKDGNFKTNINIIDPKQKIEGIKSLSPPNPDKELDPATKFEITPLTLTAYHKDGSVKFVENVKLPNYKTLIEKLKQDCYKSNMQSNLYGLGIINLDANMYFTDCYKEEIKKQKGVISKSEDGAITIVRVPLMNDELKSLYPQNSVKGAISANGINKNNLYLAKTQNVLSQMLCKAIMYDKLKLNMAQKFQLCLNQFSKNPNKKIEFVKYGKEIQGDKMNIFLTQLNNPEDPEIQQRKENIDRFNKGNDPNNFDDVTFINNKTKKIIGKAIYEGEDKMVMSQRYKLKEGSQTEVEVVNNEFYVIDPITNTEKVDVMQITYENVSVQTNL